MGLVQGPAHASGQANFPVRALQLQTCNCNPCRAQKASLWGWALGSVCTVVTECYEVVTLSNIQKKDESDEAWSARRLKAQTEINNRLVVLTHALVQVGPGGLAVGTSRKAAVAWAEGGASGMGDGSCCCPGAGRCGGSGDSNNRRLCSCTPLCSRRSVKFS